MASSDPLAILNRLYALHHRSLPAYLASAPPWSADPAAPEQVALRHVAEEQEVVANRLASIILEQGGTVEATEFPMEFTDLHDLSIDFLLRQVRRRQEHELEYIRQSVGLLKDAPAARAIAEEALGSAQAHLDNLKDLQRAVLRVTH